MLTKYYTEEELLKELDIIIEKYYDMRNGWLGKKLSRLQKKQKYGCLLQQITYNKQVYDTVTMFENKMIYTSMNTSIESKYGKFFIHFTAKHQMVFVQTPHYTKRCGERCGFISQDATQIASTKYRRNDKEYELFEMTDGNCISIVRRSKTNKRLVYFITALNREMCTSKNYQELLSRVGKQIDDDDIYEWK
jgi:hypothetical protein